MRLLGRSWGMLESGLAGVLAPVPVRVLALAHEAAWKMGETYCHQRRS